MVLVIDERQTRFVSITVTFSVGVFTMLLVYSLGDGGVEDGRDRVIIYSVVAPSFLETVTLELVVPGSPYLFRLKDLSSFFFTFSETYERYVFSLSPTSFEPPYSSLENTLSLITGKLIIMSCNRTPLIPLR